LPAVNTDTASWRLRSQRQANCRSRSGPQSQGSAMPFHRATVRILTMYYAME